MWKSPKTRNSVIILLIVVLGTTPLMVRPAFSQLSHSVSLSSTGEIETNINAIFSSSWENSGGTDITDGGMWMSGSTGAVVTSPVCSGNYAARFAASSGSYVGVSKTLSYAYGTIYFRAYFYFSNALACGTDVGLMGLYDSNWVNSVQVVLQNCAGYSEWQLIAPSGTFSSLPAVVNASTWYCIEIERQTGNGNGTAALWVNGNMLCNSTSETMTVGTQNIGVGVNDWGSSSFTAVADDVVASATGPIGPESPIVPPSYPAPISNFQMCGAQVCCDVFVPTAHNYNPDAWQLLKEAGVNTICVTGGIEGNTLQININNDPNWAQNLNNFLSEAAQNGIKVYFFDLGDSWGSLFGILSPGDTLGNLPPTPITEAEAMINELAGNNSLGHDFITDPRILMWVTSNESPINNATILSWNLQLCDYIRSLGGKACIASPYVGDADYDFGVTLPLLQENVDYVDIHAYMVSEFINLGMNYTSFFNFYKSYLETAVVQPALQNGYSLSQVILGEFGIWIGTGTDLGLTNITFTNTERTVYYQAVFNAALADGIQNVVFHTFFEEIGSDGIYLTPNYGVVDSNSTTFYPNLLGIINNAYNP